MKVNKQDTIAALATAAGIGAIAVIRVSGAGTFELMSRIFRTKKGNEKDFNVMASHTIHFGYLVDDVKTVDEVLCAVLRIHILIRAMIRLKLIVMVLHLYNNKFLTC